MSFTHALRIAGYNRRLYVVGVFAVVAGIVFVLAPGVPRDLRIAASVGVLIAAWFTAASFLAFYWMFDRSELLTGRWLPELVPAPARWIQINAGLEETTLPLETLFPHTSGRLLDIYQPDAMTEPALARAREREGGVAAHGSRPDALGIDDASAELIVVMLAAHEIREPARREAFFRELVRALTTNGTIVLVEHLRNIAAALTFGPGLFHFLPRSEWLRLAGLTGLKVARERSITPYVTVLVCERVRTADPITSPLTFTSTLQGDPGGEREHEGERGEGER
jgi:SAM-dependent methyltransferase